MTLNVGLESSSEDLQNETTKYASPNLRKPPPQKPDPPSPLQTALKIAHTTFANRNPNSQSAYLSSLSHLPGGNTRTVLHAAPFPLTFSSASGAQLHSLDHTSYTDFLGEYTAGIYGHNHPTIRAAIDTALDSGWSFGGCNIHEKQLAKTICARFAPAMELVRFCNSGTEANMMAVAAAVAWTGRNKVCVFGEGYHGATLSFRGMAAQAHTDGKGGSKAAGAGVKNVNLPHEWVIAPYNDVEGTREVLEKLEPGSLATIIVEPMLGSGGGIPGSKPFLQFLRDYATENGALLIFDEVMTSRLGYRGLGFALGVRPDLMTLGKWVGGGMSFGAFGGRRDIMAMFDPSKSGALAHPGTFNNNVISMAAGVAGCELLNEERLAELNSLGDQMRELVQAAIDENLGLSQETHLNGITHEDEAASTESHQHITLSPNKNQKNKKMWVTGLGSILVIHFAPSSSISAAPHQQQQQQLHSLFYHHMLTQDIYMAERGFMALSVQITRQDVEGFVRATAGFVVRYRDLILGAK